jgi:hypothetical protein
LSEALFNIERNHESVREYIINTIAGSTELMAERDTKRKLETGVNIENDEGEKSSFTSYTTTYRTSIADTNSVNLKQGR